MIINAYAAYKAKEELKTFTYEKLNLKPAEVFIKITHCGICHSDVHLIDNDWYMSKYPLVPGHEVVGIIEETGTAVTHLKPGDRVGIGWQAGSCHICSHCLSGDENLCSKQVATAVGHYGGFAEYLICEAHFAFPVPETLDSENAAPLLCGGITVYSPLVKYNIRPEHKVGVIGIGGLGHLALQFAKAYGCEVTAFSSSPDKEKEAYQFGAIRFINSKNEKDMKSLMSYFDYIITTVTAPLNWQTYINLLKPYGRLNFVGATVGEMVINPGTLLQYKTVSGSVIGGSKMISDMLDFAARHNIKALTETMKMSEVNEAIKKVRNNTARYRMVLTNK